MLKVRKVRNPAPRLLSCRTAVGPDEEGMVREAERYQEHQEHRERERESREYRENRERERECMKGKRKGERRETREREREGEERA